MRSPAANSARTLPTSEKSGFESDVLEGLSRRPREVSPRWFYDRRGSELFEQITELEEYYPTRTERELLVKHAAQIGSIVGAGRALVEFGSGSSSKTPVVAAAVAASCYVPIDISGDFLMASSAEFGRCFPELPVHPLVADFNDAIALPAAVENVSKLRFFPGSTIGNMSEYEAVDLLRRMADTLNSGSMLLIGMDRVKPESILIPAYDDNLGVTAEFNLNLLHRINRELDGDIPVDAFRHLVKWNAARSRIEMHLAATRSVRFSVAGHGFAMEEGETIHTENSRKFAPEESDVLLRAGGWARIAHWTDPSGYFSLILASHDAPSDSTRLGRTFDSDAVIAMRQVELARR